MMSMTGARGEGMGSGDVANKVIHASRVPVWLVPTELREAVSADVLPGVPWWSRKRHQGVRAGPAHAVETIRQRGAESESELVLLHVVEGSRDDDELGVSG